MKIRVYKLLFIYISLFILLVACSKKGIDIDNEVTSMNTVSNSEVNNIPEYFQHALTLWNEGKNRIDLLQNSMEYTQLSGGQIESSYKGKHICFIDSITFNDGKTLNNIEIDVTEFYEKCENSDLHNFNEVIYLADVFYESSTDYVYCLFNSIIGEQNGEYYGLLVEFPYSSPYDYQSTEYSLPYEGDKGSGAFLFYPLRYENKVYQYCLKSFIVIDIDTKEARFYDEEYEKMYEFASSIHEYGNGQWYNVNILTVENDVVVYEWNISESNDTPLLMSCFFAFKGDKIIGTMTQNEETGEVKVVINDNP